MIRKAFTLIELLVVIAIIAILAAILFPVFAQAKAAAKSAASLSNTKQQTLGNIMYAGDFDDMLPLGTAWNTGRDQACYGAGMCFAVWSWSIAPYVKNTQIYMDPQTTPNGKSATLPQANYDSYYIQYGYNYTYLSPLPLQDMPEVGVSSPAVGAPADTVMLGAKWAQAENTSGSDWGTWFPNGQLAAAAIDSVDCNNIPTWCMSGWGKGSMYESSSKLNLPTKESGRFTGGNSLRAAGNSITSFVDGHVKKLAAGALAAGTNWNFNAQESAVSITDTTKYLWDLQ